MRTRGFFVGKQLLFIFLCTIISLNTSAKELLSDEQEQSIKSLILKKDADRLRELLSEYDDLSSDGYLMDYAVSTHHSVGETACRPEIVEVLLEKKIVPKNDSKFEKINKGSSVLGLFGDKASKKQRTREPALTNSVMEGCTEVVEKIIKHFDLADINKAGGSLLNKYKSDRHSDYSFSSYVQKYDEIIALLKKEIESKCKEDTVDKSLCNDSKLFGEYEAKKAEKVSRENEYKEKRQKEEAERAALIESQKVDTSSPNYYKKRACNAINGMKFAEQQLNEQKEIEKESGIMNMAARRQWAAQKVYAKKDLESVKKEFKDKFKKDLDTSNCN